VQQGVVDAAFIHQTRIEFKQQIERDIEKVFTEANIEADIDTELADMYKPTTLQHSNLSALQHSTKTETRYLDAISDALRLAMRKFDKLVLMGQDIAEYGGAFKITQGFVEEFGRGRVRNTPICESAIVGAAMGLSINGYKAVMEMQFADFATCGFNQIVNNWPKPIIAGRRPLMW